MPAHPLQALATTASLLLLLAITACGTNHDNDKDEGGVSPEEQSALCDDARTKAADDYNELDRACTQDSDCKALPIGGCGCPIPLSTSANIDAFNASVSAAQSACDEYYVAPGAQTCLNAVICDYGFLETGDAPICNEQGFCDEPTPDDTEPQ